MKKPDYLVQGCAAMMEDHFASIDAQNLTAMSAATLARKLSLSPSPSPRQQFLLQGNQCRDSLSLDWRKYGGAFRQCVSSHL